MGFTLSLTAALLVPLQGVVGFFAPWTRTQAQPRTAADVAGAPAQAPNHHTPVSHQPAATSAQQPVRIVRVLERGSRETRRMVISGRLADVCAELERLAALEAAAS